MKQQDTLLFVLEALKTDAWSEAFQALWKTGEYQGVHVSRAQLKRALEFFERLVDPKRGAALRASIRPLDGTVATVIWRRVGNNPRVPMVRLRLDEYAESLEIEPPEEVSKGGRRYSDYRLKVDRHPDHIVVWTDQLATDVGPSEHEEEE